VPTVLRIIVGASGSPGSLRALRYARHLARDYDATLVPVLAWLPPCGDLADRRTPNQKLEDTLNLAWGTPPTDLPVQPLIRRGKPGPVLADAACRPGDLLLVGAGRRGAVARTAGGRVSRYCLAHAPCPVLALPPPPLAYETPHGALGRAFRRRTLTTAQISPGKRRAAA
jgi:nucleotide-binding universal stress UspA family protein